MIMTVWAESGVGSGYKRGLVLCFLLSCAFLWICFPLCVYAQIEAEPLDQSETPTEQQTEVEPEENLRDSMERWEDQRRFRRDPGPFVRQGAIGEARIKVSAEEVMDAISAGHDIDIDQAIIEGDLDIGSIAGGLRRDENGRYVVQSKIMIRSSEIKGEANFSSTAFNNHVVFSSCAFGQDAVFTGSTFRKYANFNSSDFNRSANFADVNFEDNTEFISASFNRDADFRSSKFLGYVYFRSTVFKNNADFTDATMKGAVDLIDATFTLSAVFLRTSMDYPASFEGVKYRENTVIAGMWNNVICIIVKRLTGNKVNLPLKVVTNFSRFDTGSIMDGSSNPYLKRYIDDEQWIDSWRSSAWWREPLFVVWEISSHCGRSIGLWAFWSASIAVFFAIIYSRFLSDSIAFSIDRLKDTKPTFSTCLYYSVVTLVTLGYGDIVPLTNRARLAAGVEVSLGYIMLGGLVSIFANKVASRS